MIQNPGLLNATRSKVIKADFAAASSAASQAWKRKEGDNYHASYAYSGGCIHSKLVVVVSAAYCEQRSPNLGKSNTPPFCESSLPAPI
jgi:hypothetical protein